jgi:septal ring factor EnvC (AmiA/AmiB activator)
LDFEKDSEVLRKALYETDQRIKKLEEHKESLSKQLRDNTVDDATIEETLRRLERNLDDLHKKHALIIKELEG